VDIPGAALNITGPLTISAWVKMPATLGLSACVISKGAGLYQLSVDGSGFPEFTDEAQAFGNLAGINRVDDNQWHHLAGVYDGTNSEYLYVDGQMAAESQNATNLPLANANDFFIGGDSDFGVLQFFDGTIDEVAIFTNVLSAEQITWLFSTGSNATLLKAAVASPAAGTITLSWSAIAGQKYQVEYSTNLTEDNWRVLGDVTTATNSALSVTDSPAPAAQRFYRVVLVQ
jgi:hypothetical protein